MIFQKQKNTFYCFSPPVMLATFIIEGALALYVFLRFKASTFNRLAVLMIVLLGLFQFAEYNICSGANQVFWMRLGFVVITCLPPIGIHLISLITGRKAYLEIGYAAMICFAVIFAFIPNSLDKAVCGGNYVIFEGAPLLMLVYGLYYFGFLILGIYEGIRYLEKKRNKPLGWILIGYLAFLLPMGAVYIVAPETRAAVPSVMCGFAIIFALILALVVVPEKNKLKK